MASSTSEPMAMVIPPSVIVLMFILRKYNTIIVPSNESGMATTEITVVRKLAKNRKRMITTNSAPSRRAVPTLRTDDSIKSA